MSKCSMARGGVAVVGDGGAVDSAHTRGASGAEPARTKRSRRRGCAFYRAAATTAATAAVELVVVVVVEMVMAERWELRGRVLGLEVETARCG